MQATCAGLGVALAGIVRDILVALPSFSGLQPHTPYNVVFMIEIGFLALAILLAIPLAARFGPKRMMHPVGAAKPNPVEAQ